MARFEEGHVRTRGTRTGDPRKITEWSVRVPGGKDAKFSIHLEIHDELMLFVATSDHPWFREVSLHDADLNVLKEKLGLLAQERIRLDREGIWAPASLVRLESRMQPRDEHGRGRLEFSLTFDDVEFMPAERRGNRGETTIRTGYKQEVVIQRGPEDVFPCALEETRRLAGKRLDHPEVRAYLESPLRDETDRPMTRVLSPGEGTEVDDLAAALEGFFGALQARMSPGRVALEGVVRPEELVGMLEDSTTSLQAGRLA